jgi:hypothetical protein
MLMINVTSLYKSSLVALVLIVGAAGYAQAAPAVAGSWRWFNPPGSEVYFNPNGTAQHLAGGGAIADHGIWRETSSGNVDITWSSGFVDHWQVSADGSTMTGHNSHGPLPTVTRER